MTKKLIGLIITAFLNASFFQEIIILPASDSDIYIYGTVYTEDNEEYTGQIRWGKEEAFWFDHFNSSKPKNDNLQYLSRSEERELNHRSEEVALKGLFGWTNFDSDHTHSFSCQFGNIKAIEIGRRDRVEVELKNGDTIKLEGGSNDIDTYIQVADPELGNIKLEWNRVERVEFKNSPQSFESYYGAPLYGTVLTESGVSFTGYVQWDHDERLAHDELNGENRDGDIDLEFGKIKKIVKSFRGSEITLHSGRTLELKGTNDVNDENRGIIVNIPGQGRVDIPWDEFEEVDFVEPKMGIINYDDFDGFEHINGSVITTNGKTYKGQIVYDLDETYQFEILNGELDDIEYFIPFQLVKSIEPSRRDRAIVQLKSGQNLKLEDSVDVSEDHDGVLVFADTNDDDPVYIKWEDIEIINL